MSFALFTDRLGEVRHSQRLAHIATQGRIRYGQHIRLIYRFSASGRQVCIFGEWQLTTRFFHKSRLCQTMQDHLATGLIGRAV